MHLGTFSRQSVSVSDRLQIRAASPGLPPTEKGPARAPAGHLQSFEIFALARAMPPKHRGDRVLFLALNEEGRRIDHAE